MHDVAGISNEALGVWFRFREMMGLVRVQFKGARWWWVVRACPAALPSLWSSRAPASVACECVRACVPNGQGDTSQVWSGLPGCLVPASPGGLLLALALAVAPDWSRRSPTRQST